MYLPKKQLLLQQFVLNMDFWSLKKVKAKRLKQNSCKQSLFFLAELHKTKIW